MEASHGDWQYMTGEEATEAARAAEAAEQTAEAELSGIDNALALAGEAAVELEVSAPPANTEVEAASKATDAQEGPSVPVPPGFPLRKYVRMEDETPEEIERKRRETAGPKHKSSFATPRSGLEPVHTGSKRGARRSSYED